MTNWDLLLKKNSNILKKFAFGELSGRQVTSELKNTETAGEFRTLLRSGVVRARSLARKAIRRRS